MHEPDDYSAGSITYLHMLAYDACVYRPCVFDEGDMPNDERILFISYACILPLPFELKNLQIRSGK